MEKRLLLAFLITIVFFSAYSRFMSKRFPQPSARPKAGEESIPQQETAYPEKASPRIIKEVEFEPENLPSRAIGHFIVTYSTSGGYIQSIAVGAQENILPFKNIGFVFEDEGKKFKPYFEGNKIGFKGPAGRKKEYVFEDYALKITFSHPLSDGVSVFTNYLSPSMLNQRYQEVFYSRDNVLKRSGAKKVKEEVHRGVGYAGARDRYYCLSLLQGSYDIGWVKSKNKASLNILSPVSEIQLYIGPQTNKELKPYGLEGIVYYGFFHAIGMLMIKILYFFHLLTRNWGVSVILLAVFIYVVLFPFTMKSSKAMRKMQQIQPAVEELKKKYKDTPQKLQKETIELYRKYKVNPLGGCLPLFFQFPIFISLYQVLFRFVELKGAKFLWVKDLSAPDHLFKLPFPQPLNYINLFPLLIVVVGLIQQKITTSSSAPEQKKMGLFFSVFLGVIFYNFPSALVLYWFVQNLLTLAYQSRLSRTQPIIAQ